MKTRKPGINPRETQRDFRLDGRAPEGKPHRRTRRAGEWMPDSKWKVLNIYAFSSE